MVIRTIVVAMIFLGLYSGFIAWHGDSHRREGQSQWQNNMMKTQRFLYDAQTGRKDVIVGSSLSALLVTDSIPDVYNLAMSGQSAFDGLTLILGRHEYPKRVFIEMNNVLRPRNEMFVAGVESPLLFHSRKWLPALREENQPVGIMGTQLRPYIARYLRLAKGTKTVLTKEPTDRPDLFNKMLAIQQEHYRKEPGKETREVFENLEAIVRTLNAAGTEVVFFEMPVNCALTDLPLARSLRHSFEKTFDPETYSYVPPDSCTKYRTVDGIHLSPKEAITFSRYFGRFIER